MTAKTYTCNEYREEMILLGLQKRLADTKLTEAEKTALKANIKALEKKMGLD